MKSLSKIIAVAALAVAITVTSAAAMASELPFGSSGAMADDSLTLNEMLTYSIQDEYMAKAEYELIMDEFGAYRPYTNIAKSEATHISLLTTLFEKYGLSLPSNDASTRASSPSSLIESYKVGIAAEKINIAMYDKFLGQDIPADVRDAFTKLRDASKKHLRAFENALDRSGSASASRVGSSNGQSFKGRGNSFSGTAADTRSNANGGFVKSRGANGTGNGTCVLLQ